MAKLFSKNPIIMGWKDTANSKRTILTESELSKRRTREVIHKRVVAWDHLKQCTIQYLKYISAVMEQSDWLMLVITPQN